MELGEKIKAARLALGLSQRQLCDGKITRNMLSQIENGAARPSMDTLSYLARRLGKSVSYFLEEQAVVSPNIALMQEARAVFSKSETRKALEILEGYTWPDELFEQERQLLEFLCCLGEAEQALRQARIPYAKTVLQRAAEIKCAYVTEPLLRQLYLLQSRAGEEVSPEALCHEEALLERARLTREPRRKLEILAACEERETSQWHFLAAEAWFALKDYASAAAHYALCEDAFPEKVWPRLECCCRELGDYKGAYEYACKQK